MKVLLVCVGKTDSAYLSDATRDYLSRAAHYLPVEVKEIPDVRNAKNLSRDEQKQREGEQILRTLQTGDYVVLLDEGGKMFTSESFAQWLQLKMNTLSRRLVFVIGGPFGFSSAVYDKADARLSLSQMTFSHQMVRLIFAEQYYRALSILNNLPYHHG